MKRRDVLNGLAMAAAVPAMAKVAVAQETEQLKPQKTASVEGCVALVTGSNRGVGLGFVNVLLERGAKRVYATARNPKNFPAVVALDPSRVVPLELDGNNDAYGQPVHSTTVKW